jgi:DNA-directed RNA polymerase sigma subunit (sigma70/sigma32)
MHPLKYQFRRVVMNGESADDVVAIYKEQLASIAPLSLDEVQELFQELRRWRRIDEQREIAAKKLIEGHLPLVAEITEKHLASGIPWVDLIQEGNLALLGAMESYSDKPSGNFRVYAATRIDDALTKLSTKSG